MVRLRTVDAFPERPFSGSPAAVLVLAVTVFDGALSETAEPGKTGLPPAGMAATLQP